MKTFANKYEKFWIEDGIMFGEFTMGLVMDIEAAKICLKDRIMFAEGLSYPFLLDARGLKHMTKEARDYLGAPEGSINIKASAIVIGSPVTKIIGNFFLIINSPVIPVKMFNSVGDGIAWLKTYK